MAQKKKEELNVQATTLYLNGQKDCGLHLGFFMDGKE